MEENHKSQEAKTGSRKEQGMMNSGKRCEQCCRNQISQVPFSSVFCYSFFLVSDLQC